MRPQLAEWAQLLFDLMWETGLRVSEALSIERACVNTATGEVQVQRVKGGELDTVLASKELARRLAGHYRPRYVRDKRVFPYSVEAAQKALARACKRAEVRHIHPHQFRHSFGFAYAQRPLGIGALEHQLRLMKLLGHKDLRATAVYFQPADHQVMDFWKEIRGEVEKSQVPLPPEEVHVELDWVRVLKEGLGLDK